MSKRGRPRKVTHQDINDFRESLLKESANYNKLVDAPPQGYVHSPEYISLTRAIELFEEYKMENRDVVLKETNPMSNLFENRDTITYYFSTPLWCNLLFALSVSFDVEEGHVRDDKILQLPLIKLYEWSDKADQYQPVPRSVMTSFFPRHDRPFRDYHNRYSYYNDRGIYVLHNSYDYNSLYDFSHNYDQIVDSITRKVICSKVSISYNELVNYVKALKKTYGGTHGV